MSKVGNKLDDKDKVIRFLVVLCGLFLFLVVHAHYSIMNTPKDWTMHTPPDLSVGGSMGLNEVPDVVAYNFAFTMLAGVNTWQADGSKDYPEKLDKYRFYFSPAYTNQLKRNAEKNRASNRNRTRTVEAVLGKYSVERLGSGKFKVTFLVNVVDSLNGYEIKNETVQYTLLVVPYNIIRSLNPWQLRIEGELEPAKRVKVGRS